MVPLCILFQFCLFLGATLSQVEGTEAPKHMEYDTEILRQSFGFDRYTSTVSTKVCKRENAEELSCDDEKVCLTVSFNKEHGKDDVLVRKVHLIVGNSVSIAPVNDVAIKGVTYGCTDLYTADLDKNETISKVLLLEFDKIKLIKVFSDPDVYYLIDGVKYKQINEEQFQSYAASINSIINKTLEHKGYDIMFQIGDMAKTGYLTTQTPHSWVPVSMEI
ncbi:hypothetical protein X943_000817 [Babesia divergens]|uniref:Uncharacterized protein n=1 Tax=Babesia divergens TaxID=32595 RepID=A0AAD9LFI4_BABDI|nr:hypothetical protein X943_000817 [Babesia divergens]